jgi:hypothetical protein
MVVTADIRLCGLSIKLVLRRTVVRCTQLVMINRADNTAGLVFPTQPSLKYTTTADAHLAR